MILRQKSKVNRKIWFAFLELGAMKFHEQRRGPSRLLFSQARACPCPRRLYYERPMPAALAVAFGPRVPPVINHLNLSWHIRYY